MKSNRVGGFKVVREAIIKFLGGVPRRRYENMKRSREHFKKLYGQLNLQIKNMPVKINYSKNP